MKTHKAILYTAVKMILLMTVLCGIIYPLIVTGIAQVFFKDKANGSIIEVNGVKYGSILLGQQYTGNEYLWGRIMYLNTEVYKDSSGNKLMYAGPSNKTAAGEEYAQLVAQRVKKIQESNPDAKTEKIPVDLVTCSGSGLDPHISVAAAEYQVARIAKSRNMKEGDVEKIIHQYTTGKFAGIFGERVVNVLEVNLALDGILK